MFIFSSLQAARRAGFQWFERSVSSNLHIVVQDGLNRGRRQRALAFARCNEEPPSLPRPAIHRLLALRDILAAQVAGVVRYPQMKAAYDEQPL
jgi:hypothetical protein